MQKMIFACVLVTWGNMGQKFKVRGQSSKDRMKTTNTHTWLIAQTIHCALGLYHQTQQLHSITDIS